MISLIYHLLYNFVHQKHKLQKSCWDEEAQLQGFLKENNKRMLQAAKNSKIQKSLAK